jgi:hypothetical protein
MRSVYVLAALCCVACLEPGTIETADLGDVEDVEEPPPAPSPAPTPAPSPPPTPAPPGAPTFTYTQLSNPERTAVHDAGGAWVATFTAGARTVRLRGASRTFRDPDAPAPVVTRDWVRLLDAPWDGSVDEAWLAAALADESPDILAIAVEYVSGAPLDASYGPLVDGVRQEGSDFHDYLGMSWRFPTGTMVEADPAQLGSLDCSGFQRMVWGYRGGIELVLTAREDKSALPRRSADIFSGAPGVITIPDGGEPIADLDAVFAGDLVFFDAATDDGAAVDHVGLYLGEDTDGHHRFVSSRKIADGPTFGDRGGASTLDGTGLFARSFRAVRRL